MILLRFWNVIAAETYDCSCKLVDIVEHKTSEFKQYLNTRKLKRELKIKMKHANSYAEWHAYAEQYDKLKEVRIWKEIQESDNYDWAFIKHLTQTLHEARINQDYVKLMHLIRSNAMRNVANILNPALYCKSFIGTKHLIETFQQEMVACLDYIGDIPDEKLSKNKKLEFFAETRHAFGRTGLIFSGGANLGLYHYGIIKALYEEGLLPRIIAGSSVGSIFASFLCVRKMEEVAHILVPSNVKLTAFQKRSKKYSTARKIARLFSEGYLMDIGVIKDFMRENIGDITFQEAYDRTGWILNITVTGYGEHDGYRLLNYLTAPDVLIWSAVCASCGIPYIYGPVNLYCKDENGEIIPYVSGNTKFVDGSIGADLPMQNLAEMFNVNYFIVSQTNPWIIPFLNHSEHHRHSRRTIFYKMYEKIKDLIAAEMKHRINQLSILGFFSKATERYFNLITQQYSGHVTIWPDFTLQDFKTILDNPTTEMLRNCLLNGSRRAYPKLNNIIATLFIERALERNYLKARALSERAFLPEIVESDFDSKEEDFRGEGDSFVGSDGMQDMANQTLYTRSKGGESLSNFGCRVRSFNLPRSTSTHGMKHFTQNSEIKKDSKFSQKLLGNETELSY